MRYGVPDSCQEDDSLCRMSVGRRTRKLGKALDLLQQTEGSKENRLRGEAIVERVTCGAWWDQLSLFQQQWW